MKALPYLAALLLMAASARAADPPYAFRYAEPITPSDGANLPHNTKGIYVGTATAGQTIKVDTEAGGTATFTNVAQGSTIPIAAKKVYATGTTATNLLALF